MSTDRTTCRRCGAEVIEGVTERGLDVVLEVTELDPRGELLATVAGTPTYTHHHGADVIAYRLPWRIRTSPAGSRARTAVRPEHRCVERTPTP